ncbi:MAG: hypothetical protein ABIJ97_15175, partial [Bacteroidota bacterium]
LWKNYTLLKNIYNKTCIFKLFIELSAGCALLMQGTHIGSYSMRVSVGFEMSVLLFIFRPA